MSDLRRRKLHKSDKGKHAEANRGPSKAEKLQNGYTREFIFDVACVVFGLGMACYLGSYYADYIRTRHENDMWFTHIKEVEREISFRTESGLYYSYYKQMVNAPSTIDGLYGLIYDNKTEALRTINILERFNVYQEVVLSILYRWFSPKMAPIFFYIHSVFTLHAMYMVSLFVLAWLLSGTWLAGLLASAFYVFNSPDTTRIYFTLPLRESFSIPFIFLHFACVTVYFRPKISKMVEIGSIVMMLISTLCFVVTWQFAQFVLLMEFFALYGVYVLDIVPRKKVSTVIFIGCACLLTCCVLQFMNDMILVSLVLSFSFGSLVVMMIWKECNSRSGIVMEALKVIFMIFIVFAITFCVNFTLKTILKVDSDEHVYKFLMAKFGYGEALKNDFDAMLYLCEVTFQMLPMDTFTRLTQGVVFPCYAFGCIILLLIMLFSVLKNWSTKDAKEHHSSTLLIHRYPELMFNLILSVFLGILAMSTLRMKFLWTPHICVLGAATVCNTHAIKWVLKKFGAAAEKFTTYVYPLIPLGLLGLLLYVRLAEYQYQLTQLREFFDPDTVELMERIKKDTPPNAAFMGSMQLLAGVRLCTDRPITNHPHYENKFLRKRTKEVYQVYARRSPAEVHKILQKHGANYIILENSICYAPKKSSAGCRLPDILDIDNGHKLESENYGPGHGEVPRFCHAIKQMPDSFKPYFKKYFENKTFYLYEVLPSKTKE